MFTDYSASQLAGPTFGVSGSYPSPPSLYLAASTTAPRLEQGSTPYWDFTEPTDSAYARQAAPGFSSNVLSYAWQAVSAASVAFPTASLSWGSVPWLGLFDAMTGGNLWFFAPLCRVVTDGETTSGSTNLQSATADFTTSDVGQTVYLPGVPIGTTITSRTSSTEVVMSAEASASATGLALAIATPQTVGSGSALTIPSGSLVWPFT